MERGDVDRKKTITDWKSKILNLCPGYDHIDIVTMDETRLCYTVIEMASHIVHEDNVPRIT